MPGRYRRSALVFVLAAGVAPLAASAQAKPTKAVCLRAWNAPANAANRNRLAHSGPWSSALLGPGKAFTLSKVGGVTMHTESTACELSLISFPIVVPVTGAWHDGRVTGWAFGPTISISHAVPGNVRVRADGRLSILH